MGAAAALAGGIALPMGVASGAMDYHHKKYQMNRKEKCLHESSNTSCPSLPDVSPSWLWSHFWSLHVVNTPCYPNSSNLLLFGCQMCLQFTLAFEREFAAADLTSVEAHWNWRRHFCVSCLINFVSSVVERHAVRTLDPEFAPHCLKDHLIHSCLELIQVLWWLFCSSLCRCLWIEHYRHYPKGRGIVFVWSACDAHIIRSYFQLSCLSAEVRNEQLNYSIWFSLALFQP